MLSNENWEKEGAEGGHSQSDGARLPTQPFHGMKPRFPSSQRETLTQLLISLPSHPQRLFHLLNRLSPSPALFLGLPFCLFPQCCTGEQAGGCQPTTTPPPLPRTPAEAQPGSAGAGGEKGLASARDGRAT